MEVVIVGLQEMASAQREKPPLPDVSCRYSSGYYSSSEEMSHFSVSF